MVQGLQKPKEYSQELKRSKPTYFWQSLSEAEENGIQSMLLSLPSPPSFNTLCRRRHHGRRLHLHWSVCPSRYSELGFRFSNLFGLLLPSTLGNFSIVNASRTYILGSNSSALQRFCRATLRFDFTHIFKCSSCLRGILTWLESLLLLIKSHSFKNRNVLQCLLFQKKYILQQMIHGWFQGVVW